MPDSIASACNTLLIDNVGYSYLSGSYSPFHVEKGWGEVAGSWKELPIGIILSIEYHTIAVSQYLNNAVENGIIFNGQPSHHQEQRNMKQQYGCSDNEIAHYTSRQITEHIEINGDLSKPVWQKAEKSPRFVDMVTGNPGFYNTQAAILWNQENLYIAFWIEEPFVSATQSERDSIVFLENDVEVFIDGGDCYYELEINALNTVYEVFFIWRDAYERGGKFDVPEFDVLKKTAMTFGGDYDRTGSSFWWGRHPRGLRWAFLDWDMPGLKTAVKVDGKINDDTVPDQGWQVEIAIPWKSLKWLAGERSLPPKEGDTWRLFLGRFQKLNASGTEIQPHPAWAWNKHGVYDTHIPECFTYIHFTKEIRK